MTKQEAKEYLMREESLMESEINEFSDDMVEFHTTVDLGLFDDLNSCPYFYQIDLSDTENPIYSEGFIELDGGKHTEKSFIIINDEE